MKGLTKRQRDIIDYIQDYIATHRYSPTYREIGKYFGLSSLGSVYKHINSLKRKGLLASEEGMGRSLSPLEHRPSAQGKPELEIPLIGHITAGAPIHIFSHSQQISVPNTFIHVPDKTYALRVRGNGFNEEMIADGDILLVEAREQAQPGETIIALINEQDTMIKKFYVEGLYIRLAGCHAQHHPIILNSDDIQIQGIVLGLLRQLG